MAGTLEFNRTNITYCFLRTKLSILCSNFGRDNTLIELKYQTKIEQSLVEIGLLDDSTLVKRDQKHFCLKWHTQLNMTQITFCCSFQDSRIPLR